MNIILTITAIFGIQMTDITDFGLACGTVMAVHETGHAIYCEHKGYNSEPKVMYKGHVMYIKINEPLPKETWKEFSLSGEAGSFILFETMFPFYRKNPTFYKKSILYVANYHFLVYSIYSLNFDSEDVGNDPVRLEKSCGLNKYEIMLLFSLKCGINQWRMNSATNMSIFLWPNGVKFTYKF